LKEILINLSKYNQTKIKIKYKENNNWIEIERDGKNYTFSELEFMIIDNCSEYPFF
jgi:hypothetical protein